RWDPGAAGRGGDPHVRHRQLRPGMSLPFDPPMEAVRRDVEAALAEDVGRGDATATLLPDATDQAWLLCKEDAVVCGRPWFDACHRALDPEVAIDWRVAEGECVAAGTVLATLEGRSRSLVTRSEEHTSELQSR